MNLVTISQLQATGKEVRKFGTRISGFVKGKEVGQTRCDRCLHYADDSCNHPVVMADPEVAKNAHGDAIVADGDCCEWWWPIQKSKGTS